MNKLRLIICCAGILFVATQTRAQEIIQTIGGTHGSGGYGGDNIAATATKFNFQYMINLDAAGNLYIADNGNARIRKIDATTGIVTTVAGNGTGGSIGDGTPATAAELGASGGPNPGVVGVAVDASNNIYIGDATNNKIRRVDGVTGIITTLAGTGTAGSTGDGGPASAALLSGPRGVAVDAAGNVFFADAGNNKIRMVTISTGIITTVAGNGTAGYTSDGVVATTTKINSPRGVWVDASENVYFADYSNNRIRMVSSATGIIYTVAGNGTAGYTADGVVATTTKINGATDVKVDAAGNIYVADAGNNRVRVVNTSGIINTIAGSASAAGWAGDGSLATAAAVKMSSPVSIAVEPNTNYFYISDRNNDVIREVRPDSKPYFVNGAAQSFTICEDGAAFDFSSYLAIVDSDQGQTETWTISSAAAKGTVALGTTATSDGGTVSTTGFTYTPTTGMSGIDNFTIQISDGFQTSTTTFTVTINPLPTVAAIGGSASGVCVGSNITLTDGTAGGTWTTTTGNASVTSGTVNGVTAGSDVVSYTVTNACGPTSMTYPVTVNPLPDAGTISGATSVCAASSTPLTDVPGNPGTWSTTTGNASVSGTGSMSGVSAGSDLVSYTVTNVCGTDYATYNVTVNPLPNAGTISGSSSVCVDASTPLSDGGDPGTWSNTTGNASVDGSGNVTGVASGSDVISYTVTNGCGTAYATQPMTVNPLADPGTITGIPSVCVSGTTSLFDATGSGIWSASNTNASVDASGTVTGNVAGLDIISYTVTNVCGPESAIITVNVVTTPTAGTITGPTAVCQGANISLSNTTPGGSWSASNTNASVGSSSGLVTGVTGGSDVISYTVVFSCGTAYATYNVTINPLPSPAGITGPATVCVGGVVIYSDVTSGGVWTATNSTASVSSLGLVTGASAGMDTINYNVTNGCGTVAATKVVSVQANVLPSVTFGAAPGFTTCPGTLVTYTSSPVNGGSSPTYIWAVNGVDMSTSAAFAYTPSNGDMITVGMTSSLPCLITSTANDTQHVVVNPTLVPAVTISTGVVGDTVCVGTPTTFTATPVNGGSTPGYTWTVNGASYGSSNPFTYTPSNGDLVNCSLISSYACPSPGVVSSNNITMTVNTTEVPAVTITADPGSAVCQGTVVTFTAHPLYGGIPPFYRWTQNGTNVATGPTYSYVPSTGDHVYCMMHSSSSCAILDSVFSNTMTINTQPDYPIAVTIHASYSTIGAGSNDTLVATVVSAVTTPTYQWYVNGTAVTGANSPVFVVNSATSGSEIVNCVVTSGDICNTTAISNYLTLNISPAGVKQVSSANDQLSVMPNPNTGNFIVNLSSADDEPVQIEISNIMGQKIAALNTTTNKDTQVNISQPAGIYFVTAITGQSRTVLRVVIE
jgi:Secretion system C-terminal sorting domain/Bacterial Ig domain